MIAKDHGTENLRLVFADTMVEDDDLYRFLLEATANILGVKPPVDLIDRTRNLPWIGDETIENRKAELAAISTQAKHYFHEKLVWLADGRTPWEVFKDRRFLGNSQVDPCSMVLKRELIDSWCFQHCDLNDTRFACGIGEWERHRFDGKWVTKNGNRVWQKGLRDRKLEQGMTFIAPLIGRTPTINADDLIRMAEDEGLEVGDCYYDGFKHNNCAGVCVKGGQKHWALMLKHRPKWFAYAEQKEGQMREMLGNVSMLSDRRGGTGKKPLPLTVFRERLEDGDCPDADGVTGACNCFAGEG